MKEKEENEVVEEEFETKKTNLFGNFHQQNEDSDDEEETKVIEEVKP